MSELEHCVADISAVDNTTRITLQQPADEDFCRRLKSKTSARICVGRAGCSYRTETLLRYLCDHAAAMDAVWSQLDESLLTQVDERFVTVPSCAPDKDTYVRRPDLGRRLSAESLARLRQCCTLSPTVQIVVTDGLSAHAIEANLADIYPVIKGGCEANGWSLGTPIFVRYGRVAVMDQISEALDAQVTVLLVGERPGLQTAQSMSCYMAYRASTQKPESQRTVVSNIHAGSVPPVEAGAQIVELTGVLLREKKSGSQLKL